MVSTSARSCPCARRCAKRPHPSRSRARDDGEEAAVIDAAGHSLDVNRAYRSSAPDTASRDHPTSAEVHPAVVARSCTRADSNVV